MPIAVEAAEPSPSMHDHLVAREIDLSGELLGGHRMLGHKLTTRLDIHLASLDGIPYACLLYLIARLKSLSEVDVVNVLGISARTLHRRRETPKRFMPAGLASRTWTLAETLARASYLLGGQEGAERWMSKPAMGLDGRRPIDLLQTSQGAQLVDAFLTRLEYGVYN